MKRLLLITLLALLLAPALRAAPVNDRLWQPLPQREQASRGLDAGTGSLWRLDETAARLRLRQADDLGRAVITLPVDGRPQRFEAVPSPIMAPPLAARYPEIRTYRIRGIDDPVARGRLSMTPRGLDALFDAAGETRYIDREPSADRLYRLRTRSQRGQPGVFACGVSGTGNPLTASRLPSGASGVARRTPGSLRVYRLAMATTVEYSEAIVRQSPTTTGNIPEILVEIVRLVNRINSIYERDLAIRLELVANTDQLIQVGNADGDPFDNQDGALMIDQNQALIDAVIGPENYDIGHVLSTGGGGIANVDSVCINNYKAGGVTGSVNPQGDAFYVDYVAHEMGHQFGADHSFNGTSGSCGGNRWPTQAWEPGSGATIMSYAGICGGENLSNHALDIFHGGSIEVIENGASLSCGTLVSAGNPNDPVVDAGADRVIPKLTPFRLQATASDGDGDALTHAWEQMDAGRATDDSSFGKDLGDNALFRSYGPQPVAWRDFPSLGLTLDGKYDKAEVLPCQSRTLNFRVTVRDGKGGLGRDAVRLTVDGNSGPFRVTSHTAEETLYPVNGLSLSWDVAGTDRAPVSCGKVDISLLSFDGDEYGETLLAANEDNDGLAALILPDRYAARARFKVACSDNVFYAVSAADLHIAGDPLNPFPVSGFNAFRNQDSFWTVRYQPVGTGCDIPVDSGSGSGDSGGGTGNSGDSGSLSPGWLLLLGGLWGLRRRLRAGSGS